MSIIEKALDDQTWASFIEEIEPHIENLESTSGMTDRGEIYKTIRRAARCLEELTTSESWY